MFMSNTFYHTANQDTNNASVRKAAARKARRREDREATRDR
jgi:hypothetical protein